MRPSYRHDWRVKHHIACACGETWAILADRYDFNFEVEKASAHIQRSLHRLYNCRLTTLNLKGAEHGHCEG